MDSGCLSKYSFLFCNSHVKIPAYRELHRLLEIACGIGRSTLVLFGAPDIDAAYRSPVMDDYPPDDKSLGENNSWEEQTDDK